MDKSIILKTHCIVLLNYFIHTNLGGSQLNNIWEWQIGVVSNIDPKSSIGKNQLKSIYNDTVEGIKDFSGEQLKDLYIYGLNNEVVFNLGKTKDFRIINFFLREKKICNPSEFTLLSKLFDIYKNDKGFNIDDKIEIDSLLSRYR